MQCCFEPVRIIDEKYGVVDVVFLAVLRTERRGQDENVVTPMKRDTFERREESVGDIRLLSKPHINRVIEPEIEDIDYPRPTKQVRNEPGEQSRVRPSKCDDGVEPPEVEQDVQRRVNGEQYVIEYSSEA